MEITLVLSGANDSVVRGEPAVLALIILENVDLSSLQMLKVFSNVASNFLFFILYERVFLSWPVKPPGMRGFMVAKFWRTSVGKTTVANKHESVYWC